MRCGCKTINAAEQRDKEAYLLALETTAAYASHLEVAALAHVTGRKIRARSGTTWDGILYIPDAIFQPRAPISDELINLFMLIPTRNGQFRGNLGNHFDYVAVFGDDHACPPPTAHTPLVTPPAVAGNVTPPVIVAPVLEASSREKKATSTLSPLQANKLPWC